MNKQSPNLLHSGRQGLRRPVHLATSLLALTISLTGTCVALSAVDGGGTDTPREQTPAAGTSALTPDGRNSAADYAPGAAASQRGDRTGPDEVGLNCCVCVGGRRVMLAALAAATGPRYDDAPECGICTLPPAWEMWAQQHGCSDDAFALIRQAGAEYHRDDVDMACLLACIALPESTFRPNARGSANERGMAQIHPCHRARMRRMGLDYDTEIDRLRFACELITAKLDSGASLLTALKPWTPRKRVLRQYEALTGGDQ